MRSVLFILCWVVALSLTGCKTKSELRREQEFEKMKQEVTSVRTDKADFEVLIDELKTQIARQTTATEEQLHQNRAVMEEVRKEIQAVSARIAAVEQKARDEEIGAKRAAEERSRASFENGKRLFDDEKYEDAASIFRTVIQKSPKTDEGRKSHFFLAESLYASKDYASAAIEYSEYKKAFPKDPLVPNALYRMANSFRAMGKNKEAKLFYSELIEKFPRTHFGGLAKAESKKLK